MINDLFPELQDILSGRMVAEDRRGTRRAFEADIKRDKRFTLPAGSIRPYQLWFGFLKAALQDPDLQVDRQFYGPWGAVELMTFAQWWPDHWRDLFAIDRSIRVAESSEDVDIRDGVIWVRLPLGERRNVLVTRVSKLVHQRQSERESVYEQGRFGFDCGTDIAGRPISPATRFLKNLDDVDMLLWLYAASLRSEWAKGVERDEEVAGFLQDLAVFASGRGRLIKTPKILEPFLAEMKSRDGKKRVPLPEQKDKGLPDYRRAINRYLDNARAIARNVAQGHFPGRYANPDRTEP